MVTDDICNWKMSTTTGSQEADDISTRDKSSRKGISHSIIHDLRIRELTANYQYRKDTKIMRKIVCSEKRKYVKTWKANSLTNAIYYENRSIFMNGYRDCFTVRGLDFTLPVSKRYSLPKCRVKEILWCQFSLIDLSEHKVHCVTLIGDNSLQLWDCEVGNILRIIELDTNHKYIHIDWNVQSHTFYLKTKLFPKKSGADCLTTLALFQIFPVVPITTFNINRSVFGLNITNAAMFEDILYLTSSSGEVNLYNLKEVLGNPPESVVITELPPLLYSVKNTKSNFQIGGVPWTFIIPSAASKTVFEIRSLVNGNLLENGRLIYDDKYTDKIYPDTAYYHPDDSGRILHTCISKIKVKRVVDQHNVNDEFSIALTNEARKRGDYKMFRTTSFGRIVKVPPASEDDELPEEMILTHCYEDELDLLAVLHARANGDGWVTLHDNQNGNILKTIHLDHHVSDTFQHTLVLDVDILVHLTNGAIPYICYLYSLV